MASDLTPSVGGNDRFIPFLSLDDDVQVKKKQQTCIGATTRAPLNDFSKAPEFIFKNSHVTVSSI